MRTRPLGQSGPDVSVLGLGCNSFGLRIGFRETQEVVEAALETGITLFDTADLYGRTDSERYLGDALGSRRDRVVIATKWGFSKLHDAPQVRSGLRKRDAPRGSATYLNWALEQSLRRLSTDWIDVYQYHKIDEETPLEETFEALAAHIESGKVRFVGLPTLAPSELDRAVGIARGIGLPVVSMQVHYNFVRRDPEREVLPLCHQLGIGVLAYLPLEGGLLTGKYSRGKPAPPDSRYASMPNHWPRDQWLTDEAFDKAEALERFAAARGISLLEVAIGGLVAMPAVGSVIAGATRADQVWSNARASEWVPSNDDVAALVALGSR